MLKSEEILNNIKTVKEEMKALMVENKVDDAHSKLTEIDNLKKELEVVKELENEEKKEIKNKIKEIADNIKNEVKKVSEEYYASGRAYQNNNLEITYDSLTIDDVKGILSKQNIGWNEINKNRIVGHDYDTNIYLELFKERGSDKVTLILQKRN